MTPAIRKTANELATTDESDSFGLPGTAIALNSQHADSAADLTAISSLSVQGRPPVTSPTVLTIPAYGNLSRNTDADVVLFTDPIPEGGRILSLDIAVVTRALFFDLFGKGVVAGDRFYISSEEPFEASDMIGMVATFGPPCGKPQEPVSHTVHYEGAPPRYAYGQTNAFGVRNDYNPVHVGPVTLTFTWE